jgi:transposase
MLQIAPGVRVYLACRPVDMRRGFDGLSADVAQVLKADPFSGAVFVFRGKRGDYLKILTWDGSGLCLFAKRLENGKFVWPPIVDGSLKLTVRATRASRRGDRLASHGRSRSIGTALICLISC